MATLADAASHAADEYHQQAGRAAEAEVRQSYFSVARLFDVPFWRAHVLIGLSLGCLDVCLCCMSQRVQAVRWSRLQHGALGHVGSMHKHIDARSTMFMSPFGD
jgi:hypothetical protein